MGATKSLLSYHHYIPCTSTGIKSSIEAPTDPTDTDEASISTEPESMKLSGTTSKREAAKHTCDTMLTAVNIKSSPDEDTPARKRPCLQVQASLLAIAADADTLNASPDDPGVAAPVASPDTGTDPMPASPMQPNDWAARAPRRWWTPEEDKMLTSAVKTTCKKKYGEEYRTHWVAIAELVPGRTRIQGLHRWHNVLESEKNETTARVGKRWTKEEDVKLKDAIEKHNGKNWAAIAALVPGRTKKKQCLNRRQDKLRPNTDETIARVRRNWTNEEDSTLEDAIEKHNDKDWAAISALVLDRTKTQLCMSRWYGFLDSKSDATITRVGKRTIDEDSTQKDAVVKHNGKHNGKKWQDISALVPGRSKKQCTSRWHAALDSKSDETTAREG